MSDLKVGDFAIVRTTGEPVFILNVYPVLEADSPFKQTARVRRPVSGRAGIVHMVEEFYVEELESEADSAKRRYLSATALQAELGALENIPEELQEMPDITAVDAETIN